MMDRRALQAGAIAWAMLGFTIATASLARMASDAPVVVLVATVAFPACAVGAAAAIGHGRFRLAGMLLLLSVATPTYFFWVVNAPALVASLALVVAPPRTRVTAAR